jgi:hypothetical protein
MKIGQGSACTGGAINLRNEYRDKKLPVNEWAVDLKNGNDISYFETVLEILKKVLINYLTS